MLNPREVILAILLVQLSIQPVNSGKKTPASANYMPLWMYQCVPNLGCQRVPQTKFVDYRSGHYKSLNICRLLCSHLGTVWPIPSNGTFGLQTRRIHPDLFRFILDHVPAAVKPLLVKMMRVAMRNLYAECRRNMTIYSSIPVIVNVTIKTNVSSLFWNIDESYSLSVQSRGPQIQVQVLAATIFGARHALETFVQLVVPDVPEITDNYFCSLNLLIGTELKDAPTYTHRGLLLDTARNFIPLDNIKKMIEGMGATKMNVFHWHVTDSQSFPLQSVSVPQFTKFGANSASEIYTTEQVRALVDFALVHGVRVVIEIDSPAHAGNGWQWGKGEYLGTLAVCVNAEPWRDNCFQPPCGQLNPVNPNTYRVLQLLYLDIDKLLPDPVLLHVGGSEVNFNCWNNTKQIKTHLLKRRLNLSIRTYFQVWAEFHKKALEAWDEIVEITKLPVMIWSSSLTSPGNLKKFKHLNKDRYVIEVKEDKKSPVLEQLLQLGYRTVAAPHNVWSLDHLSRWTKLYSYVLPNDKNMLGGEAAMWTEHIDVMGLDAYVWPRAAAVAERLWSNPKTEAELAEPRLQMLRERLINRGLRPDVVSPVWCARNDGKCKGSYP